MILDGATAAIAFAIGLAAYPFLIRAFRRLNLGQVVQAELSEEHQRKAGTPTGGGILFVGLAVLGGLLSLRTHAGALPALVALLLFGGLGLLDDLRKLWVGSLGVPARFKLPVQLLLAIPVAAVAQAPQHLLPIQAGWLYWPLAVVDVGHGRLLAEAAGAELLPDRAAAVRWVRATAGPGDRVLIKASHGVALHEVVEELVR